MTEISKADARKVSAAYNAEVKRVNEGGAIHPFGLTSWYDHSDGKFYAVDAYTLRPVEEHGSFTTLADVKTWCGDDWVDVTPED